MMKNMKKPRKRKILSGPRTFWVMMVLAGLFPGLALPGCGGGGGSSSAANTETTHTVSGRIAAAANVVVDGDVNDPNENFVSNNSQFEAQEIPNPVILGGFVNVPNSGDANGRFFSSGDADDYFRVALKAGDTLSLIIGEDQTADLDLYLYNDQTNLVDASLGTGKTKFLEAPSEGTYTVRVNATSGASNYTLSIGTRNAENTGSNLTLSSDFVPGQVIVQYKEKETAGIAGNDPESRAAALGLTFMAGGEERPVLLGFEDEGPRAFNALDIGAASMENPSIDPALVKKFDTLRTIKALRKRPDIEYAEPNYRVCASGIPNDPLFPVQWNLDMIHLPEARDVTPGSSNIVIAIVDTGVLMGHPDLQGQLTDDGYDFISSSSLSLDGGGIDSDPSDPGDLSYGTYSSFHGTHCAGIASAVSDNAIGISGVAGAARIMPVRVLGKGGNGTNYDVLQGVRYAAGLSNDSGTVPTQTAQVISLSLVGGSFSATAQSTYNEVRTKGISVVAAAGNSKVSTPGYPAAYEGVISVSAVDISGTRADYSNYGSTIDVAAPGGDGSTDINHDGYADGVMSTCGNDRSGSIQYSYDVKSGTSMATPHVAGVIALMKAIDPAITPADVDGFLVNFLIVSDIGQTGRDDYYGYGLIDAKKAADVAFSGVSSAALKITPSTFDFGLLAENLPITAGKTGDPGAMVTVTGFSDNADWLMVIADSIDGNGLGTYHAEVDRSNLPDGNYSAVITFSGSVNAAPVETIVRVYLQMNSSGKSPDSGFHYVLLVNPDTLEPARMVEVVAQNGFYSYGFSNVPHGGEYQIYAGSDRDFNDLINNYGESFGAYGSIDQPMTITVNGDMNNLDFPTELSVTLPAHNSLSGNISIDASNPATR